MHQIDVQGVVSAQTGEPLVQIRETVDDEVTFQAQLTVMQARDIAQNMQEAAANAIYDAALIAWAKERGELPMGLMLVDVIRRYRADRWGLPDRPEDWRTHGADDDTEEHGGGADGNSAEDAST